MQFNLIEMQFVIKKADRSNQLLKKINHDITVCSEIKLKSNRIKMCVIFKAYVNSLVCLVHPDSKDEKYQKESSI